MRRVTEFQKTDEEKVIVGSAWPYAHAMPHLGNLLCLLAADAYSRFFHLTNKDVVMVSGSDQHGARMEFEARQKGISPKKLVEKNHQQIKEYLDYFEIGFQRLGKYSKTESEDHKKFVQDIYKQIYENNYLLTREEELPYCSDCEMFLPDRFVEGECPHCGYEEAQGNQCEECLKILDPQELIEPRCAFCSEQPVFKKTTHWYLDLPKLSDRLKRYVEKQDQWSKQVKNLTLGWIKEGLKPRPITRDVKFGISAPFPNAEGKTMYVWSENVLGYISATKEWAEEHEGDFEEFWKDPNTKLLFTLGKDNIPFHTVIFPSIILASGEEYLLPDQIYANEYLTFNGKQFSKSKRRGIWLDEAKKLFDNPDYWRYYLFSIFPEQKDTDFSWKELETRINDEVIANFANFIYRALSFLNENFDGRIPEFNELSQSEEKIFKIAREKTRKCRKQIEAFKLRKGLKTAIGLAVRGNKYLTDQEPWNTIDSNPEKCARTVYTAVNLCKILAVLVEPYLPVTAEKIWKQLNLESSVHEVNWQETTRKRLSPGHSIKEPELLFDKVNRKDLKKKLKKIRKNKD